MLAQIGTWPMIGTPAWSDLTDEHPAKWAAVLDAAQHWALRLETSQEASCAASRQISAAVNWGAVAKRRYDHNDWHAARPWLRAV